MAVKTDTEVIIGGKVLTLSGYESEEYLQRAFGVSPWTRSTSFWS